MNDKDAKVQGVKEQDLFDVIMATLLALWAGVCLGIFIIWR